MQQQARILVRVAVVANLLLAVVLSVMFFMKPNPEQETEKPSGASILDAQPKGTYLIM